MDTETSPLLERIEGWSEELDAFSLPTWHEIPDFGLYMEQVIVVINQYVGPVSPQGKDDAALTQAAINNYVRKGVMPKPIKKRYYRIHLAYLVMICTLKQSMSIATLQRILPADLTEAQMEAAYTSFVRQYHAACEFFIKEMKDVAKDVLGAGVQEENAESKGSATTQEVIVRTAISGGLTKLLVEALLSLDEQPASMLAEGFTYEDAPALPPSTSVPEN